MPGTTRSAVAEMLFQAYGLPCAANAPWPTRLGRYVLAGLAGKTPSRCRRERRLAEIRESRLFDHDAYLTDNPDVAAAGLDAARHYRDHGGREGRDPHPLLDAAYYLCENPDVAASGLDPLLHYQRHGSFEGRLPNAYLQTASTPWDPAARRLEQGTGRKRLLVFSHEASRTGAPLVLLELLRRLVVDGTTDVCLILLSGGPLEREFRDLAATIVLSPEQARTPDFRRLLAVARFLFGNADPDVALCNTVCTQVMAAGCAGRGLPVLSLVHEMPTSIDGYSSPDVFSEMLRHSRRMAVVSECARSRLAARYGVDPQLLAVVPPGCYRQPPIETDRRQARAALNASLGLDPDAFLVLGCGSIQTRKGVDLFVQAAGACLGQGRTPMHFLWVGQGDPEARIWLDHDAALLGVAERVHFLGAVDDPWPFFQAANAFFLPSREDPFPQVVLEAMACSLPVVVFAGSGGAAEAVADGAGIVCPYLDVPAVARCLVGLADDPEQGRALGQAAAARVAARHGFDAYVQGIASILTTDFYPETPCP